MLMIFESFWKLMSLFSGSTSRMRLEELGGSRMSGWRGSLQALPSLRWRYLELSSHQISNIENIEKIKLILMWLSTGQAGRWGRLQGAWWNQDLWEQSQGGVNLRLDLLVFHCRKNAETWICLQKIQKVKVNCSLTRLRWAEEGEMVLEDVAEAEGEAGLFS